MKNDLTFVKKSGQKIESVFDDLGNLRIQVFHDFPYLYQGNLDYEREYLHTYSKCERAFLFAVYDQDKMVGATTCIPLTNETEDVRKPFEEAGYDIESIFYFGESILLPTYRGLGLGHRFFDEREAHTKSFSEYDVTCFCSVVRPEDHPLKPEQYRPNDAFWLKRGYQPQPSLISQMEWMDIGEAQPTLKDMVFWMKKLTR